MTLLLATSFWVALAGAAAMVWIDVPDGAEALLAAGAAAGLAFLSLLRR